MKLRKGWKRLTRASGLVEQVCPHGCGHPDPDSIRRMDQAGAPGNRGTWGVHGCDGCCLSDMPKEPA